LDWRERRIDLNNIDHQKENISDVIGISEREFQKIIEEIFSDSLKLQSDIEKLRFSEEEIKTALNAPSWSEAIAYIWEKRGQTNISLEEFFLTLILLKEEKSREERLLSLKMISRGLASIMASAIEEMNQQEETQRIIEMIKANGTEVLFGTRECIKLVRKNEENRCPAKLGCIKLTLIQNLENLKLPFPIIFEEVETEIEDCLKNWKRKTIEKILKAKDIDELKAALVS
jgi:hypothetical protein